MTAHEYVEQTAENRVALFFQHIWGVIRRPRSTIEILVERRPIREALMIFLILAVLSGISRGLLTSEAYIEAFDLNFYFARLTLLGGSVLIALFAYLVPFSLMAGGFWVMIRILGEDSSYLTLFSTSAFIAVIFAMASVARLALAIIAEVPNFSTASEYLIELGGNNLLSMSIMVWYAVLSVFVVRYASGLSTGRAIVAVAIPVVLISTGIYATFIGIGLNILSRLQ